ncbi:hypothetical protein KUTeg_001363 [Tegillarca granosa]|uniref:Uncharacterized protein n=1 Tax=Tegillarca granosa TaxID=220873 RepID=A0ABQ9FR87_TEGGR|nr:hypothetical protein KUTeg_001363 [Tegillarca granosa]
MELMKDHCNCEVRKFDFSVYPDHVAYIDNGAWRPIILQTILEEFGSVAYLDPAARLKNVNDLNMLKYRGSHNFFLWEHPVYTSVIAYTNPKMFEYLGEKRCPYMDSGMMDIRTMVLYRTNMTWHSIMKPLLKCSLDQNCISPSGARRTECFHFKRPKTTGCHWYDQSAFSIIMNRVYQFTQHLDKFSIPRLTTYDLELVYYFPIQPWTYTEILLVITMPLLCVGGLWYLIMLKKGRRSASKTFYKHR